MANVQTLNEFQNVRTLHSLMAIETDNKQVNTS